MSWISSHEVVTLHGYAEGELDALGEDPVGVGSFDEVAVVAEQHDLLAAFVLKRAVAIDDRLVAVVGRNFLGVVAVTQSPVVVLTEPSLATDPIRLVPEFLEVRAECLGERLRIASLVALLELVEHTRGEREPVHSRFLAGVEAKHVRDAPRDEIGAEPCNERPVACIQVPTAIGGEKVVDLLLAGGGEQPAGDERTEA